MVNKGVWSVRLIRDATGTKAVGMVALPAVRLQASLIHLQPILALDVGLIKQSLIS